MIANTLAKLFTSGAPKLQSLAANQGVSFSKTVFDTIRKPILGMGRIFGDSFTKNVTTAMNNSGNQEKVAKLMLPIFGALAVHGSVQAYNAVGFIEDSRRSKQIGQKIENRVAQTHNNRMLATSAAATAIGTVPLINGSMTLLGHGANNMQFNKLGNFALKTSSILQKPINLVTKSIGGAAGVFSPSLGKILSKHYFLLPILALGHYAMKALYIDIPQGRHWLTYQGWAGEKFLIDNDPSSMTFGQNYLTMKAIRQREKDLKNGLMGQGIAKNIKEGMRSMINTVV